MARMIIGVSLPEDVAKWVDTHWEKGKVSGNIVDLIRITMKGAGGTLPPQRDPNDYSRLSENERMNIGITTLAPHKEKYIAGQMSQIEFFAVAKQIATKLKINDRSLMAATPGRFSR